MCSLDSAVGSLMRGIAHRVNRYDLLLYISRSMGENVHIFETALEKYGYRHSRVSACSDADYVAVRGMILPTYINISADRSNSMQPIGESNSTIALVVGNDTNSIADLKRRLYTIDRPGIIVRFIDMSQIDTRYIHCPGVASLHTRPAKNTGRMFRRVAEPQNREKHNVYAISSAYADAEIRSVFGRNCEDGMSGSDIDSENRYCIACISDIRGDRKVSFAELTATGGRVGTACRRHKTRMFRRPGEPIHRTGIDDGVDERPPTALVRMSRMFESRGEMFVVCTRPGSPIHPLML